MAKRIETVLTDDLDGSSTADETLWFSLDGTEYEIDLTAGHAAEFRSALNVYVGAARKVHGRPRRRMIPRLDKASVGTPN